MKSYKIFVFLLAMIFFAIPSFAKKAEIVVTSQSDFDAIMLALKSKLKEGNTEVDILLKSGVYSFTERHIDFDKLYYPNATVRILGENASVVSQGRMTKEFDPLASYFDNRGNFCEFESRMKMASSSPETVDAEKGIYKISLPEKPRKASSGFIYLTMWYRGLPFRILSTKGNEVYFKVEDITLAPGTFSPDWDLKYGKVNPRYKLINTGKNRLKTARFKCENSTFLSCTNCLLKGLVVSGVRFIGNKYDPSEERKKGLIRLYCCNVGSTLIENCDFRNIQTDCINITQVHNVTVRSCVFEDCYRSCVFSHRGTKVTCVMDNTISRCGKCGDNVQLVTCQGEDFVVRHNSISDFGYGAISAGVHYSSGKVGDVTGIISDNEIFQTSGYFKDAPMNLLMDGGAIYILTQNDNVVIEKNYIHDISGPRDNRGIFCDDGTCNVDIKENRIERIANSFCIDLRLVLSVETEERSKVRRVNVGNSISDNVVDGPVRFERHP